MVCLPVERAHSAVHLAGGWLRGRIVDDYDSPDLRALLARPEALQDRPDGVRLKDNSRSLVVRLRAAGVDVVVKRYRARSWRKAVKRLFAPSPAARAWYAAHWLDGLGIDTAAPIAYVERRYGPLRGESWLVSAYIPGQDAWKFLLDGEVTAAQRQQVVVAIVRTYARLHAANVTHGDNRPGNFVIRDGRPYIIDLSAMLVHPAWNPWRRRYMRRDLRRLTAAWRRKPAIAAALQASLEAQMGVER